ncbi:MAG: hypothetical protein PHV68_07625 [Candidatus Gastranaerophilales bacterium]|nr:hypothetical protein [Candidatus Gastranaerophilales bacterium]
MGKCKKRLIAKAKNEKEILQMTRSEAIIKAKNAILKDNAGSDARYIISLFGITAEELAEAGVSYEILRALDSLIN